ncbi:MAG: uL15m family ribosomal protein [Archaeoglobaceae archaeon]
MPKKSVKKYRGSGSCGGGFRKKRRGRGHRGGSGNAGWLKHKYISTIKSGKQIGKYGFTRPEIIKSKHRSLRELEMTLKALREEGKIDNDVYSRLTSQPELNVGDLELLVEKLQGSDFVSEEGGNFSIDLTELGYEKLLGKGRLSKPVNVKVDKATEKALGKIEEAGGQLTS